MSDDYLWNRSGEPDKHAQELESVLALLRYEEPLHATVARPRKVRLWLPLAAAAVILVGVGIAALRWSGAAQPRLGTPSNDGGPTPSEKAIACTAASADMAAWTVTAITGTPRCGSDAVTAPATLPVGGLVETDSESSAEIVVADIGRVVLSPNSRMTLKKTEATEHRLQLDRGKLHAQVNAPPRLFLVETPAALAVDLGCEYTLEVSQDRVTHLHVTYGYVALENGTRDVYVPAGYVSDSFPKIGPTAPYAEKAPGALRTAVHQFARAPSDDRALETVLAQASTSADTLTLWHLLSWGTPAQCERIARRLRDLVKEHRLGPSKLSCDAPDVAQSWRTVLEPLWEDAELPEQGSSKKEGRRPEKTGKKPLPASGKALKKGKQRQVP